MHSADFTWLHLSDFHLGKDEYGQQRILKRILDEIESAVAKNQKPDFVFITGDIANKGHASEFESFDKEFLTPLMENLTDSHLSRVFLVPGNHDVDRAKARAVRRYDVLDEIGNFLDPTPEGRNERELLLSRFKAFDEYPWYLDQHRWVTSTNGYHAKQIDLPSGKIGVLCVNTAWLSGSENEKEKLDCGIDMLESGLSELADCAQIFVLGHHPIDWFSPTLAKRFLAMLGKIHAIYLHGHLHKTQNNCSLVANNPVLCLQAGCAFHARNDEQWLTRLLWGGFQFSTQEVYLRPKKWNADHHEWVLDSDAFPESTRAGDRDYWVLPLHRSHSKAHEASATAREPGRARLSPPEGWVLLDKQFLAERRKPVTDDQILQYFEGRVPHWEDVLSGKIPARSIVDDLVATVTRGFEGNEPQLNLLLGAGGEGKSTAFLQVLERLASTEQARILWRSSPEAPFPPSFAATLAGTGDRWLLASDEGDSLIAEIFRTLSNLGRRSSVHILLACRDTDWIQSHGNDLQWAQVASFAERRMKGLDERDAQKIVKAWATFGSRGLGKLDGLTSEEAVGQLIEAARVEATTSDGAFLGAMLRVRVGAALRDHVAALMMRLEARQIAGLPGKTLLDAFAYIAIPHAYNILFLSKSVLGRAIGIDEGRVRRRILQPLGEEAAAAATGQYILIRHRAIAEAAMEIASSRFEIDPEDILADLVRAAIVANEAAALVPHLKEWRYLSSRMFEEGNQSLGVRLAATALAADPTNSYLAVKLAQLYREAGQAEQSIGVFRTAHQKAKGNRAFYTEWATCEGSLGSRALSVWINAISLADGTEMRPPDAKDVGFGLIGCFVNFLALFERYQHPAFLDAATAAARIAKRITLPRQVYDELQQREQALIDFKANFNVSQNRLLEDLTIGFNKAYDQRELELSATLLPPVHLTFLALRDIARL